MQRESWRAPEVSLSCFLLVSHLHRLWEQDKISQEVNGKRGSRRLGKSLFFGSSVLSFFFLFQIYVFTPLQLEHSLRLRLRATKRRRTHRRIELITWPREKWKYWAQRRTADEDYQGCPVCRAGLLLVLYHVSVLVGRLGRARSRGLC